MNAQNLTPFQVKLQKSKEVCSLASELGRNMRSVLHELSDRSKHESEKLVLQNDKKVIEREYNHLLENNPEFRIAIIQIYCDFAGIPRHE